MPIVPKKIQPLLSLMEAASDRGYIGEPVSQLEHALQCAYFATNAGASSESILAALFHDIGHLCAPQGADEMEGLGIVRHEDIGANYLQKLGFSITVCELVRGHVQAKRFLTWKNPSYLEKLSSASRRTLDHQGGPMSEAEALAFEQDPLFKDKLRVRSWDEMAKDPKLKVPPLAFYIPMILEGAS